MATSATAKFRTLLLDGLGLDANAFPDVSRKENWLEARRLIGERIATMPRDHWVKVFAQSDACVTSVLTFDEAMTHEHNVARKAHVEIAGKRQPAPAPRFSATPASTPEMKGRGGTEAAEALAGWGIGPERLEALGASGVIG